MYVVWRPPPRPPWSSCCMNSHPCGGPWYGVQHNANYMAQARTPKSSNWFWIKHSTGPGGGGIFMYQPHINKADTLIQNFYTYTVLAFEHVKHLRKGIINIAVLYICLGQRLCVHVVFVLKWNSWTSICQKTRVFCSMLFTVPSTCGFYRKPYTSLVLKIHAKNLRNKKTKVCSMKTIL